MATANIFGFCRFEDLQAVPVLDVTEDKLMESINAFVAEENRVAADVAALFSTEVTDVQTSYEFGAGGTMQPIDELVGPEATKTAGKWYVGYPIRAYGDRQIYTQSWMDRATLADLNTQILNVTLKDMSNITVRLLEGLLDPVNFEFDDSNGWPCRNAGPVNVRRLCNADASDGSVYVNGAEVTLGGRTHYKISGAAAIDAAAFELATTTLMEVGCDKDIVHVVSPTTGETVRTTVDGFMPILDPNVSSINEVRVKVAGARSIGRIGLAEVMTLPHFPNGYMFSFDRSKDKPLGLRQHDLAKYRGLQLILPEGRAAIPTNPLINKHWVRCFGVGARNRVNGVAIRIIAAGGGNAYAKPALA